jgi:16S rRNA (uracil1498-N3)-methyltransferase
MDARWPASVESAAHVFVDVLADDVTIADVDGHHLARVLRVRTNDVLTVANGRGRWRTGAVTAVDGGTVDWHATTAVFDEPTLTPSLSVAFALGKGDKPERVVRQLTELGVDRIRPVISARTVLRWDGSKRAAADERFRKIAREAAMQSRRARVPRVDPVADLAALRDVSDLVVGAAHGEPAAHFAAHPAAGWTLAVGPEGGFAPAELAALGSYSTVALAPFVLRTETAPVALAGFFSGLRVQNV